MPFVYGSDDSEHVFVNPEEIVAVTCNKTQERYDEPSVNLYIRGVAESVTLVFTSKAKRREWLATLGLVLGGGNQ